MGGFKLAVDAVERVRHRMADGRFLEIALQIENVLAQSDDLGMLRFGNAPDEEMKFARIEREIRSNFLADKCMPVPCYLEAAVDRVVVRDRHEIHPALAKKPIEVPRVSIAIGKIEPPKEPFFRPRATAGMNMEIAKAHTRRLNAAASPPVRDPVPVGRRGPIFEEAIR